MDSAKVQSSQEQRQERVNTALQPRELLYFILQDPIKSPGQIQQQVHLPQVPPSHPLWTVLWSPLGTRAACPYPVSSACLKEAQARGEIAEHRLGFALLMLPGAVGRTVLACTTRIEKVFLKHKAMVA